MVPLMLWQVLLVMHLSGVVLMTGPTVIEFVVFRTFINLLKANGKASVSLLRLMSGLGTILLTGGLLLVLSGVGLPVITGGVFLDRLWLNIKRAPILLLPLNGLLVGSPQIKKLRNNLSAKGVARRSSINPAVTKLTLFHTVQTLRFLNAYYEKYEAVQRLIKLSPL